MVKTKEEEKVNKITNIEKNRASDDIESTVSGTKDIAYWIEKLNSASLRERDWRQKAKQYHRKYLNEASAFSTSSLTTSNIKGRYNIFYSNTELLKAALLPEIPQIVLERRFAKEQAEPEKEKQFYTTVSEVVERAITYNVKSIGIEKEFEAFKYDYLITGRGVLWVTFTTTQDQSEKILIEHIHYSDFRMSCGRNWSEIWWIARRHLYNRQDLVEKFGSIGKEVPLNYENKDDINPYVKDIKQAEVWEVWDKTDRQIHFVSPGYNDAILTTVDDPYHLEGFFPTPEPLRSIRSNETMIPTPELDLYIREYQDLSRGAMRASHIIDSIKPRAFFPAQFSNIIKALQSAEDTEYVGIDDMSRIMEMGGMQNMFAHDPIDVKQRVAAGLFQYAENTINVIYEITGISDIMRNRSVDETATATLQKGKFGSLRLQERQTSINNYVKSVYKIATELICELFTIKTLQEITSINLPTQEQFEQFQMALHIQRQQHEQLQQEQEMQASQMQQLHLLSQGIQPLKQPMPQATQSVTDTIDQRSVKFFEKPTWQRITEFLRNNRLREYLIDIETTFNIWENDEQSQRARIDLLNVFSESISKALPIISSWPQLAEIYLKLISFSIDSFRVSRSVKNQIEDSFTEMIENIKKAQSQPQQQESAPEEILAQAEIMRAQAEQTNAQTKEKEAVSLAQIKMKEAEIKFRELEIKEKELELKAAQISAQIQIDKAKLVTDTQMGL